MNFFRYPGGKTKIEDDISSIICSLIYRNPNLEYREPFFGGGSIGLGLIYLFKEIWINDKDIGLSCLWDTVINNPDTLIQKIQNFTPSVEVFKQFKEELLSVTTMQNPEDLGFKKLVVHQLSYSGVGVMGGPLGGLEQKSKYHIDCRWYPDNLVQKILKINKSFKTVSIRYGTCTSFDFDTLIQDPKPAFLYLDPPYYVKGKELYQYSFTKEDHVRLAESLKKTEHFWLLSYDDCPEIHSLYQWAKISKIKLQYTINNKGLREEVLIAPHKMHTEENDIWHFLNQ